METQATIATTWLIDPMHSEVQFKVKHLMVSTVTGLFTRFEGRLDMPGTSMPGDGFEDARIHFLAEVGSISTGNEQRDTHLQSAEFFDAGQFPNLTFQSTGMIRTAPDQYTLGGEFTMHGVTRPVTLKVEYGGQMQDFYGNTKAGFEVTGTLKRKDFGLNWDAVTEAGGVVVGDEVKLVMNIQVVRQA